RLRRRDCADHGRPLRTALRRLQSGRALPGDHRRGAEGGRRRAGARRPHPHLPPERGRHRRGRPRPRRGLQGRPPRDDGPRGEGAARSALARRDRGRSAGRLSGLLERLPARSGHFRLESGHHTDVWLELELLYVEPERVRPLALELAGRLRPYGVAAVCGALVEGAFVALTVAAELRVDFTYAERIESADRGLFPIDYRLPGALRG